MTRLARPFTLWGAALVGSGLLVHAASPVAAQELIVPWQEVEGVVRYDGTAIVHASTAALILSGQVGGGLPLAAFASTRAGDEHTGLVTVQVELDGRALLIDAERATADLELFVYALDAEWRIAASTTHTLSIDLHTWRSRLDQGGLGLIATLALPAGEYQLRALVRDRGTDAFGVTTLPTIVPAGGTVASTSWLIERREEWMVALPNGDAPLVTQTLRLDRASYLPAALPVWSPQANSLAIVSIAAGSSPPEIDAHLESADGTATATLAAVSIRQMAPFGDRHAYLVEFRVPDLPDGRYNLVADSGGDGSRLPVLVWRHPEGLSGSWRDLPTDPDLADVGPPPAGERSAHLDSQAPIDLTALASGYEATLELLASGDVSGAAHDLRSLEAGAENAGYDSLRWLEKAQGSAVSRLASSSPRQLLPLFLLHVSQIEYYREQQSPRLGENSVRIARKIAQEMRRRSSDPEGVETAALATALLGEILRQSGRMRGSEVLFRQSLNLDPTVTIALVGLAAAHEQTGRYKEAVATLSQLAELEPQNPEARLRLAVNLRRVGQPDKASRLLRSTIEEEAPDWVHLVAVQESARIALEAGDENTAIEKLRGAAKRWPDDQSVAVFLAYSLDRRGGSRQARAIVERLAAAAVPTRPSSRHRYTLTPAAELREIRALLMRRAGLEPPTAAAASPSRAQDGRQ